MGWVQLPSISAPARTCSTSRSPEPWTFPGSALRLFFNVETGNLTGTSGDDRLTLTGAQLDAILDGASSKIDLGAGDDDSIYLTGLDQHHQSERAR